VLGKYFDNWGREHRFNESVMNELHFEMELTATVVLLKLRWYFWVCGSGNSLHRLRWKSLWSKRQWVDDTNFTKPQWTRLRRLPTAEKRQSLEDRRSWRSHTWQWLPACYHQPSKKLKPVNEINCSFIAPTQWWNYYDGFILIGSVNKRMGIIKFVFLNQYTSEIANDLYKI